LATASRKRADAGQHDAVGLAHAAGSLVTSGVSPERASARDTLRRFPAP
jgi:hypothetical protein